MALSLEEFVAEVALDLKAFEAEYRKQHAADPERYPLEFGDDNAGLWGEFFFEFMTSDTKGKAESDQL